MFSRNQSLSIRHRESPKAKPRLKEQTWKEVSSAKLGFILIRQGVTAAQLIEMFSGLS